MEYNALEVRCKNFFRKKEFAPLQSIVGVQRESNFPKAGNVILTVEFFERFGYKMWGYG
ncbi:hypothetical protein BD749_2816 [Pontibacter ramchanderi]|uniref:Uncharacterized protein n=1 Tax=Pontibacter ramchanderi TaxID=1179743 RepID=A0A2N3U8A6_9BACT|nr:hypothetical protein BD749_2816 [Pontibacter ramchanderi]